jgi:riboflavin kinase / FMN adenylyltransferase
MPVFYRSPAAQGGDAARPLMETGTELPIKNRGLDDLPERFRGGVLSIGNFDGVHSGHACIVERLVEMARSRPAARPPVPGNYRHERTVDGARVPQAGTPAVVLTFDPHPARLLHPEQAPAPISWTAQKAQLLCGLGVDAVVAYPTDLALLRLTAREFFDRIILGRFRAQGIVEGQNFFFGHDRGGNIEVLGGFCRQAGIPLEVVEPALIDGLVVSSSRVRALISAGQVVEAARLLGRPYRVRGTVVHGQGRGNRLGYPTANIGHIDTLLPGEGIYAGRAWIDGLAYATAMSLGSNPTFNESEQKVEAFLLDYDGDLYGRPIEIDFLARLRDIKRFNSVEELIDQIAVDVAETRKLTKDA